MGVLLPQNSNENMMDIIPNLMNTLPDEVLCQSNSVSSATKKSTTNVDSDRFGTSSLSSNGSDQFRALLEHVRRMPMVHAQEQESLINSFQLNNNSSLPYNQSNITNDPGNDADINTSDNDKPHTNVSLTREDIKEMENFQELHEPNFQEFQQQFQEFPPTPTAFENESLQQHSLTQNEDPVQSTMFSEGGTSYRSLMATGPRFPTAAVDGDARSFSRTHQEDGFHALHDKNESPTLTYLEHNQQQQQQDADAADESNILGLIQPSNIATGNINGPGHSTQHHNTADDNMLGFMEPLTAEHRSAEHSLSVDSRNSSGLGGSCGVVTEYMSLPPPSNPTPTTHHHQRLDDQSRETIGSLRSHEMSEISFKRLPLVASRIPMHHDDTEDLYNDIHRASDAKNVVEDEFLASQLLENEYSRVDEAKDEISSYSTSSMFMKDLNTQSLSTANDYNEEEYDGGDRKHQQSQDFNNITTPSPIVFKSGADAGIESSGGGQSTSGGELLESDLISSSLDPTSEKYRNKFAMSYFRYVKIIIMNITILIYQASNKKIFFFFLQNSKFRNLTIINCK